MENNIKQVIIINPDTKYNSGRMMAQVAHAVALMFIEQATFTEDSMIIQNIDPDFMYWLKEHFTKLVYKAESDEALHKIARFAFNTDVDYYPMIEDDGIMTAIAFKPQKMENLEKFLSHFKLKLA